MTHCTRVSTISALMQGVYDGNVTVAELKKHGDFGIGTFDRLDGEMIVLDGQVWQAKADGTVVPAADDQTTPFATVTCFSHRYPAGHARSCDEPIQSLQLQWPHRLPSQNMIYAVEIHGTFPSVTVRANPGSGENRTPT